MTEIIGDTEQSSGDLRMAASLAQAQQREQQLLLLSSSQPAVPRQPPRAPLGSLGQQLGWDRGGCSGGAVSMLPAIEVALDCAEVQGGGVLMLWRQAQLVGHVSLGCAPQQAAFRGLQNGQ